MTSRELNFFKNQLFLQINIKPTPHLESVSQKVCMMYMYIYYDVMLLCLSH